MSRVCGGSRLGVFWELRGDEVGLEEVAVHAGDPVDADLFGAGGFAFTVVGAVAEDFGIVLDEHAPDAVVALGLALRQHAEVSDFGRHKEVG